MEDMVLIDSTDSIDGSRAYMKYGTELKEFYSGKSVLITGHTGFKGTWLCEILSELGAQVTGYALEPPTEPSLFSLLDMQCRMNSIIGDICDLEYLRRSFEETKPEIVIHMAAQPIVRESYKNPVETYATNVMGTVHMLECVRLTSSVKSVVNVTTDKVYRNNEWDKGYVETDYLDGYDPYSNSKSCSELVTHSYVQSFLHEAGVAVSTCRAGNVIGGGDFAKDRVIPDCIRAATSGTDIVVRNPYSTRPFQHVIEPLMVYLQIAMEQYKDSSVMGCYNVGPDDESCVTTGDLVTMFCKQWNSDLSEKSRPVNWVNQYDGGPHEANFLKLDCTKLKNTFNWRPKWSIVQAVDYVVEWEKTRISGGNIESCMQQQIESYMN